MNYRLVRLGKEIMRILNNALLFKINDERLSWISITEVTVTPDLQLAKVFFSRLSDEADEEKTIQLLTKASGFMKKEIADAHLMRRIPELRFIYDDTGDRARRVEEALKKTEDD